MGKLLYITANPKAEADSYGLKTGSQLIRAYRENHPKDPITHLDLYREEIPFLDADVMAAWGKLAAGASFDSLTGEERSKVSRIAELTDQFISADRYVFVSPMWNFSLPPVLKAYIDTVCIAGKTFQYTEAGPVGLLQGKRAVHIHATGGVYSQAPADAMDFSGRYLTTLLNFLGISDVETIHVEGMNQYPDKVEDILKQAMARAWKVGAALGENLLRFKSEA
ncbi:FMN-dependent NADH-azoreductase [Salinithrix halophila]|uniref:FMN dependent NADH:quinone oxidoreductase n=1 Tax=Salinithrix halophila TaxID=1485204 RepID=A0ABV8JGS1_9BACL